MCNNNNTKETKYYEHVLNTPYDPEYTMPCVCILTGEKVDYKDYSLIILATTNGMKLFKLCVASKFQVFKRSYLIELIQETIGNPININNLKC